MMAESVIRIDRDAISVFTPDMLSPRRKEVAALIAEGYSNREIAKKLFIEERTVEHHINFIFKIMGLHDGETRSRRVMCALTWLESINSPQYTVRMCPNCRRELYRIVM